VGSPAGSQPNDFFATQFSRFVETDFCQPAGNVPALAILLRAYCIRLPGLIIGAFDQSGRSAKSFSIFVVLLAIVQHVPLELSSAMLPHVFSIAIGEDEAITHYDSALAVFMSVAASLLGPDIALRAIPSDLLQRSIIAWGEA
jgi:hypothetical protein